jgi:restriction alleviation protein Lar
MSRPVPLSCPCCGSYSVHVGPHSFDSYGVRCMHCGLHIARSLPEFWPKDLTTKYRSLKVIERRTVERVTDAAITAWNQRVVA